MTNMLVVPAFKLGHPMLLVILKKANNGLFHEGNQWRPISAVGFEFILNILRFCVIRKTKSKLTLRFPHESKRILA